MGMVQQNEFNCKVILPVGTLESGGCCDLAVLNIPSDTLCTKSYCPEFVTSSDSLSVAVLSAIENF